MNLKWNDPLEEIKGLGPRRSEYIYSQGFATVGDLLLRAPLRFIDRRQSPPFNELLQHVNKSVTAVGRIESVGEKGHGRKKRLIVIIGDGTGFLSGVWFQPRFYRYVKPKMKPDRLVAFSGKIGFFDGPQITHPQVTFLDSEDEIPKSGELTPIYPSGKGWDSIGLSNRSWPRFIRKLLDSWDGSGPYVPDSVIKEQNLLPLSEAVEGIHFPETPEDFDRALSSLKFAELFYHQLLMTALRRRRSRGDGIEMTVGDLQSLKFIAGLPFQLSKSQIYVLNSFIEEFKSGTPMYRLLQGEVGSGKTVVALTAAAMVADSGYQTALMAPTELLARQHYKTALDWCESSGMKVVLVTGSRNPDEIRRALYEASTGHADLIIGTHALFQARVKFTKLGLVVIDEQQRFGVRQRSRLVAKGRRRPHVLLMTATPIPRTLALTYYGDLNLSFLDPLPNQTRNVKTRVTHDSNRDKVFKWLREQIGSGERAYLIFPVIDEGAAGLEAAEARFKPYSKIDFKGIPMALAHGRLPVEQRQKALDAFRAGDVKILVATSVVEVGVDVPEANVMVIENSERFGLSQLHQLRGRIGRSGKRGVCVLITPEAEGDIGFERLKVLEECDDGLKLAEKDLEFRGSGDPLGARQSGVVKFRLADLSTDMDILKQAHGSAERLLDQYPDLAPFPELRRKLRKDYRERPRTIMAG